MSEAVPDNGGAAPAAAPEPTAAPAAPAATPGAPATPTDAKLPEAQPPQQPGEEYKLPDAYKDKPWASKIKSEEDLFKQLDNLNAAVGKKHLTPADDAPAEEWAEYFNSLRPEAADKYNLGEGTLPEYAGDLQKMFFDSGISQKQLDKLLPLYQAFEARNFEAQTSEGGFKAEMVKSFGEKYDANVTAIVNEHKQHLTPEDQQVLESIPNQYLGVVYRLTAAMQKAYGASEHPTAQAGAKPGTVNPPNIDVVRADLRKQIAEIDARPHTAEEKQRLINDLHATYATKK